MLDKLLGENSELTAEAKASITEAFDAAVQSKLDETFEVKVSEKALELVESKEAEYQKYLEEAEVAHAKEAEEFKNNLLESIDSYLDQYVSEMVNENIAGMENDINIKKAKAIVETFEKLGLKIEVQEKTSEQTIAEAKEEVLKELEDLKAKFNEIVNENIDMKAKMEGCQKDKVIEEASSKLTEIQKEKFLKLVETFGDDKDFESFKKKVSIALESLSSVNVAPEEGKKELKESTEPASSKNRFL